MTRLGIVLVFLLAGILTRAQEIPRGTVIPVALGATLDSTKSRPEQPIRARVMQDVPLPDGARIPAGSQVLGQVVEVEPAGAGPAGLAIRFDRLSIKKREVPLTAGLRALASDLEVWSAQLPEHAPIRGETPSNWTTVQVGDDVVYRGGGAVMHGSVEVGVPADGGVLGKLRPSPGSACPPDETQRPQALWVFSTDVCGVYGFDHMALEHGGWTPPLGIIRLQSNRRIQIPQGSGLLLVVLGDAQPGSHP